MHANGRWNLRGCCRLSYTSLAPETALSESLAPARYFNLPESSALPRVLVSLTVSLTKVLFLTDGPVRQRLRLGMETICHHDWRKENRRRVEALTQAWGGAFADAGYEAVLVPSAAARGHNLIVFPRNLQKHSVFEVENEVKWA